MPDFPKRRVYEYAGDALPPAAVSGDSIGMEGLEMQTPLVSVHMITYNHEPYIRKAIECVLSQKTHFPFELVIGEDCSTDGTREIVFDYARRFPDIIRVIASDQNAGMKNNFVRTNHACRGKYIAYCEGDDHWHHPEKLQRQADFLESHSEYGLVYSDHDRYFEKTGQTIQRFYHTTNHIPPDPVNVFQGWGNGFNILTCTVLVRKIFLERALSDPYLYEGTFYIGGLDIVFSEIALFSRVHYMDESLSTYTVRIESASNMRDQIRKLRFSISVCDGYLYIASKYKQDGEVPNLKERRRRACLWLAFFEKNAALARDMNPPNMPLSFKERMLYYGAIYPVLHRLLYPFVILYQKAKDWRADSRLFRR
jgi:glycosyltransferase involved in cell wall biosynthesis